MHSSLGEFYVLFFPRVLVHVWSLAWLYKNAHPLFKSQEVKALRDEMAQKENRYHHINTMSQASILKRYSSYLKQDQRLCTVIAVFKPN